VRFNVAPGSVHAIVGPNGGGKSSLIKTLLGQMPHQGQLSLHWPGEPGTIGYVPQALEFDRGLPMTVDDFMAAMCQRRPAFLGLSRALRPPSARRWNGSACRTSASGAWARCPVANASVCCWPRADPRAATAGAG
jgi:energy-coupling factor transporter ATP-binding protein EcfA2